MKNVGETNCGPCWQPLCDHFVNNMALCMSEIVFQFPTCNMALNPNFISVNNIVLWWRFGLYGLKFVSCWFPGCSWYVSSGKRYCHWQPLCFLRILNYFFYSHIFKGLAPYPTHEKLRRSFMAFPAFSTARLRCYVTGDKPLTYQWYKNGKKFTHRRLSRRMNTTTSTLRIRNLLTSDSGLYTCRVSNPYGVYEHNITLKILRKWNATTIYVLYCSIVSL